MDPTAEPVRRTSEIEDVTNVFLVHALSNRLTPVLARFGVRPNAVSIAGMACGVAAGVGYGQLPGTGAALAGFALMLSWHVLDGVDGQLARLTNTQSETGKILDGICDYVTFTAVYLALAIRFGGAHRPSAWLLVGVSGICHALQSAAYERQRQDYDLWGWGRGAPAPSHPSAAASRPLRMLHTLYRRAQSLAILRERDRARFDERLRTDGAGARSLRARYRATFAGPIRRWSILSANYRTLALFLFAVAGAPLLYFAWEIVVLNAVLGVLASTQRVRFAAFVATERVPA